MAKQKLRYTKSGGVEGAEACIRCAERPRSRHDAVDRSFCDAIMYTAAELFSWLSGRPDFVLLDVRNEKEFTHWYIETPSVAPYINIPYCDFIEDLADSLAMIPAKEKEETDIRQSPADDGLTAAPEE